MDKNGIEGVGIWYKRIQQKLSSRLGITLDTIVLNLGKNNPKTIGKLEYSNIFLIWEL